MFITHFINYILLENYIQNTDTFQFKNLDKISNIIFTFTNLN
jgi:hypothetical protein